MSTESLHTIDDVIARLQEIVIWSKKNQSQLGYFAALYLKVTVKVKEGIEQGRFEDGPRMERLDVLFASRYIDAFDQYQAGEQPTKAWQCAFKMTRRHWPIVLQHLLMGINAHINLDLGIAAAQTAPGNQLEALRNDFDQINQLLGELVNGVQKELAEIWPAYGLLDRFLGRVDTSIINFSINKARDYAWTLALELADLSPDSSTDEWKNVINERDRAVAKFSGAIRSPGILGTLVTRFIRLGEMGDVPSRIEILE